jgi:hypothetical protein
LVVELLRIEDEDLDPDHPPDRQARRPANGRRTASAVHRSMRRSVPSATPAPGRETAAGSSLPVVQTATKSVAVSPARRLAPAHVTGAEREFGIESTP